MPNPQEHAFDVTEISTHLRTAADLSDALLSEARADPSFLADLKRPLVTLVMEGDGMYTGNKRHYLQVGRSALNCIQFALSRDLDGNGQPRSVLDFGCGFGRVARWLVAAFPDAEIAAMDVDARAVGAIQEILKIPGHRIDQGWNNLPDRRFDLIWCGSLFTHLCRQGSEKLLGLLSTKLEPNGILTTTTHGSFVFDQIRRGERTYNLSEDQLDDLLSSYVSGGYGFSRYRPGLAYGISVCTPDEFFRMAFGAGFTPLVFVERGWAKHQDFFAFRRANNALPSPGPERA